MVSRELEMEAAAGEMKRQKEAEESVGKRRRSKRRKWSERKGSKIEKSRTICHS